MYILDYRGLADNVDETHDHIGKEPDHWHKGDLEIE